MHHWLALLGPGWSTTATTATSEHLTEQVVHATGVRASLLNAILAILVVELALFSVLKHLVGALNLLELFLVATSVWMVRPRQLVICLLNRIKVSRLLDSEDLVEFLIVNFLGWTPTTTSHSWHVIETSKWKASSTAASKEHVCSVGKVIYLFNL